MKFASTKNFAEKLYFFIVIRQKSGKLFEVANKMALV